MSSLYSASVFDSSWLDTRAASSSLIYKRDATNVLNATIDTASNLGELVTDNTQLNVTAQVSRENPTNFYKFTLTGDNLKAGFGNNTGSSDLRVQILNSSGTIVADSSPYGDSDNLAAYALMSTSAGLDLEEGDYYVKVTFDALSYRSVPQAYSLALYSGESFDVSYQTTAKSQTKASQVVKVDNTMTYSLIDALEFSTKTTHLANETVDGAINIGWLYADKSALSVTSQLTSVCKEQFYSLTLQKGENLKVAFNNHTDTSEIRVQLYDSAGVRILADSHGTEAQKAAYAELTSSDGYSAKSGNFIIKLAYALGEPRTDQIYDFKVFSGNVYDKMYETLVATETAATAIVSGRLGDLNYKATTATYLATQLDKDMDSGLISVLQQFV